MPIQGYDSVGRVWINPLRFGLPDIVFLPQPYAFTQSFLYHSPYLKHFCSLAILNYGVTVADMPYMQYELPVYGDCRFIFVEAKRTKSFAAHAPALADRLYVTGHQNWMHIRTDPARSGALKCPAPAADHLAPHFTVTDDRTPHTFSNFFEYYDFFLACAREHPDIEFVMRPHPELFEHMVATGKRTREEALSYWDRFNALPNGQVYEGAEIFTLFRQSDALILDSIGFLAEYAPTGKPICFLDSMRRQRLNHRRRLIHSYGWNKREIVIHPERGVNGQDVRRERLAIVQHHLFMSGSAGSHRLDQTTTPGVKSMSAKRASMKISIIGGGMVHSWPRSRMTAMKSAYTHHRSNGAGHCSSGPERGLLGGPAGAGNVI